MLSTSVASSDTGDQQRALVDLPEERAVVDDIPDPVPDLFEPYFFTLECLTEKGLAASAAETSWLGSASRG